MTKPTDVLADVLTVGDIATILGVEDSTIRSYHSRGQMPSATGNIGRTPYWSRASLAKWLEARAPEPTGPVSSAASANYPNACDTCGARPWHPCKSPKSGRTTDVHVARARAAATS